MKLKEETLDSLVLYSSPIIGALAGGIAAYMNGDLWANPDTAAGIPMAGAILSSCLGIDYIMKKSISEQEYNFRRNRIKFYSKAKKIIVGSGIIGSLITYYLSQDYPIHNSCMGLIGGATAGLGYVLMEAFNYIDKNRK